MKYISTFTGIAFATLASLSGAVTANASAVAVDQWFEFGFGGPGSALTAGTGFVPIVNPNTIVAPDPAWTFTLTAPGTLTVQDTFLSIDQFEIDNFGVLLGDTSLNTPGSDCMADLTCAINNPAFSRGVFNLAPGTYSISGFNISPATPGAAAFIISETPVPAALPLLASGLGAMGLLGWRRKRKNAAAVTAAA
jgi:hypothetical protein